MPRRPLPRRPMPEWLRNAPPEVPEVSPAQTAAFQPIAPVGTGLYGVDRTGQTWQYVPPDVIPLTQAGGPFLPTSGGTMQGPLNWTSTGTPASRSAQDRTIETVNVKDFGAIGSGTVDDSPGINAALEYCRNLGDSGWKLVFPIGRYLVGTPLNFTGFNTASPQAIEGNGSLIYGQMNGGIVVDCTDSRWLNFYNLRIRGDGSNVPSVGIRFGMATNTRSSDYHRMIGCTIDGFWGLAAYYNNNSESFVGTGCYLSNGNTAAGSYTMVADGNNHFNVPSTYVTVTQPVETDQSFVGLMWVQSAFQGVSTGATIWMSSGLQHRYIGCYASNTTPGSSCVLIYQSASGAPTQQDMLLDLHMETDALAHAVMVTGAPGVTSARILKFEFRDLGNQASNTIFAIDPASSLTNVQLHDAVLYLDGPATGLFDNQARWDFTARYASLDSALTGSVGNITPITGPQLTVWGAGGAANLVMNATAGQARQLLFETAALTRWGLLCAGDPETGGNAGATLQLTAYADNGALIAVAMEVQRATGNVTFNSFVSLLSTLFANGPGGINITQAGAPLSFGSVTMRSGAGAATGTQPSGSLWLRTDGADGARLYVSAGGGTWNAVAGV